MQPWDTLRTPWSATDQGAEWAKIPELDSRTASGIDFDLSWRTDIGKGALSLRALVTRTIDYTDTSGGVSTQVAGFFDAATNTTLPKWRGTLSATYEHGPLTLFVQERMIGSYDQMPFVPGQIFAKQNVEAVFYTDVTATYDFAMAGGDFQMFATINNLFNRKYVAVVNASDDNQGGAASYMAGAPFGAALKVGLEW